MELDYYRLQKITEADQLFFDQIAEEASRNESLRKAAEVNSLDKFQLVFRQVLGSRVYDQLGGSKDSFVFPTT